jgi:hypothetical protein
MMVNNRDSVCMSVASLAAVHLVEVLSCLLSVDSPGFVVCPIYVPDGSRLLEMKFSNLHSFEESFADEVVCCS